MTDVRSAEEEKKCGVQGGERERTRKKIESCPIESRLSGRPKRISGRKHETQTGKGVNDFGGKKFFWNDITGTTKSWLGGRTQEQARVTILQTAIFSYGHVLIGIAVKTRAAVCR